MRVAAIQMVSNHDPEHNLQRAEKLLRNACDIGLDIALLPETFLTYGAKTKPSLAQQQALIERIAGLARDLKLWIVAGTLPLSAELAQASGAEGSSNKKSDKPTASSLVFDSNGDVQGVYSKIHLFDVDVEDQERSYRESDEYHPGDSVCVVDTPWCKLGLSICYDLRFAELYTELSRRGAELIVVPSAFTEVTGRAHWEVLLRARAIETQSYVLAANQGGEHENGRRTWGESMLVNPWGEVVSKLERGESFFVETLDFSQLKKIRRDMPVGQHRRLR